MSPVLADQRYFSLFEIARKFHLSPETVRLWVTRGILRDGDRQKLPARKIGGQWRVTDQDLVDWLNASNSN